MSCSGTVTSLIQQNPMAQGLRVRSALRSLPAQTILGFHLWLCREAVHQVPGQQEMSSRWGGHWHLNMCTGEPFFLATGCTQPHNYSPTANPAHSEANSSSSKLFGFSAPVWGTETLKHWAHKPDLMAHYCNMPSFDGAFSAAPMHTEPPLMLMEVAATLQKQQQRAPRSRNPFSRASFFTEHVLAWAYQNLFRSC